MLDHRLPFKVCIRYLDLIPKGQFLCFDPLVSGNALWNAEKDSALDTLTIPKFLHLVFGSILEKLQISKISVDFPCAKWLLVDRLRDGWVN